MTPNARPRGALLLACAAVRRLFSVHTEAQEFELTAMFLQAERAWKLCASGAFPVREKRIRGGPRKASSEPFSEKAAAGRAEFYIKNIKLLDGAAWEKILEGARKASSIKHLHSDSEGIQGDTDLELLFSDPIDASGAEQVEEDVGTYYEEEVRSIYLMHSSCRVLTFQQDQAEPSGAEELVDDEMMSFED